MALPFLSTALLLLGTLADDSVSLLQRHAETVKAESARSAFRYSKSAGVGAQSAIVRLLDFTQAEIVFNNLGGQGPDKFLSTGKAAPQEIRYRNLVKGQNVDLVIRTPKGYKPHNAHRNGILGGNGQINAKSGTSAPLTFTFVDEGTNKAHVMPKFYITFSDLDERHGGGEKERITVDNFEKYYTNDDLKIVDPNSTVPTFESSDFGNYADNDISPDSPDALQLSHAVTYLFVNKASFHATFSVESTRHNKKGRNVLFSGISQLVFCQEPSTFLDFANSRVTQSNLGGMGPMAGVPELRYSGIASSSDGRSLDLVLTVDQDYGYLPSNSSHNGLNGEFGLVNLYCGETTKNSEVYVTFSIVESGTSQPMTLDAFAFMLLDFDTGMHEQQLEYIDASPTKPGFDTVGSGYASYLVTPTTELDIGPSPDKSGHEQDWTRFAATKHGTAADNPRTAQNLARESADRAVVFTFRQTSSFSMTLGITPTGYDSGRNFMFAGQDMYLMCD